MRSNTKKTISIFSEIIVLALGFFLFVDGMSVHALTLDYGKWGIKFLDPITDHMWVGVVLMGIASLSLYYSWRKWSK